MLGEMFKGLGGAIVGGLGDLVSGHLGSQAAQRRQEDAQNFSAQQFASRYQTTVADMKAAGLNPMLAYTQGGGSAPSGTASSGGDYGRIGSSAVQGQLASAQAASVTANLKNVDAQTDVLKAEAALKRAQMYQSEASTVHLGASADQLRGLTAMQEQSVRKMEEEIKEIQARTGVHGPNAESLRALAGKLRTEQLYLGNKGISEIAQEQLLRQMAQKVMVETNLLRLDEQAAKALDNIGRESKQLQPIVEMIKALMSIRR